MLQDLCELIRMKLYASFLYQILHKWGFTKFCLQKWLDGHLHMHSCQVWNPLV